MSIRPIRHAARRYGIAAAAIVVGFGLAGCGALSQIPGADSSAGAWPWSDATAVPTSVPTSVPTALASAAVAVATAVPTSVTTSIAFPSASAVPAGCPTGHLTGGVTTVVTGGLLGDDADVAVTVTGSVTNTSTAAVTLPPNAPAARGYDAAGDVSFSADAGSWVQTGVVTPTGASVTLQPGQTIAWQSSTVTDTDSWQQTSTMGGAPTAAVASVWADATITAQCPDDSPAMPASEAGVTAVR